jgi:hypothetical protein
MLTVGENVLKFPYRHPPCPPEIKIRCRPDEYLAVMDPPPNQSAGGVLLNQYSDGWRDTHERDLIEGRKAFEVAFADFEIAAEILNQDKLSASARIDAMAKYEIAMNAAARLRTIEDDRGPGFAVKSAPDSATVVAVGDNVPFMVGDRVIIAPLRAWRFKELEGREDVVLVGCDEPWEAITPLVYNRYSSEWECVGNWLMLQLHAARRDVLTNRKEFGFDATVRMRGISATLSEDARVVCHPSRVLHPDDEFATWFKPKGSPWDDQDYVFVRERGDNGTLGAVGVYDKATIT